MLISRQAVETSNVSFLLHCPGCERDSLVLHFGVADTDNAVELASLVVGKQAVHWRGPPPDEKVHLNAFYCSLGAEQRQQFTWNAAVVAGSSHLPASSWASGRPVTFGLRDAQFVLETSSPHRLRSTAECPNWSALDPNKSQYYAFAVVQRVAGGTCGGIIDIVPLLSKKEL